VFFLLEFLNKYSVAISAYTAEHVHINTTSYFPIY